MTGWMEHLLYLYLIAINLLTFVLYGVDKQRAIRKQWRIPERTLLLLAVVGGSIGALGAMYYFRHKTQKEKFRFGVPLILALQLLLFWWIR
ncbi:MAG: DUF1294 domain-containing protein [bacterium]|nr:DUF1294 domain-containing protein [bacterium]